MDKDVKNSGVTVTVQQQSDSDVIFLVDISAAKHLKNMYDVWMSVEGLADDGTILSRENHAVDWQSPEATSGSCGPFSKTSGKLHAFVWVHPDAWTELASIDL